MRPFLHQIAALFYKEYGADISRLAFVFPNQRAGIFFKKYLSEIAGGPVFSPTILTISDLFLELSGKQPADRIRMLFSLYTIYVRVSGATETFDEFLYWGEMLLNDFDDVDKYLVDASMLFSNVTDLREIENDFGFLSEKQVTAIRSFWSSFYPKGDSPNQREFLSVWQLLYSLYDTLRQELSREGLGYEGMIFREVVENPEWQDHHRLAYDRIVFVGLNALSKAEEQLLTLLKQMDYADFYWDYASEKVTDPENKASYFVENNRAQFPSRHPLPAEQAELPRMEVIGIPSGIGQAKQVYTLLQSYCERGDMEGEDALRTAIVLPDEQMLIPVLNSIPEQIRSINVTMGYPLSGTPAASLIDATLSLQRNIRYMDGSPCFYFRDVLPVLNHRYITGAEPEVTAALVREISLNNKVYVREEELACTPFLSLLFAPVNDADKLSDYLLRLLEELNKYSASALDGEFIFHYYTTVNRLKEVMLDAGIRMKAETYARLLKRAAEMIRIPFKGEPLSGLQVMGVLETRALDFDRVIILSMNEGTFPQRKAANSFIPYHLRIGFGLPTYEHQDSVWAYHFYRLIYRASQVSLIYDTRTAGMQTGEVSRFVHQLHYLYQVPIQHKLVVYNVSSSQTPALRIEKTPEVMEQLRAFHKGGERAISASALNTYLDCPLKFYFSVVENIREEEEVTESVESSMFGSILHATLEELYKPFCGRMVTADVLTLMRKNKQLLNDTIMRTFAKEFFHSDAVRPLTGQNFLIGEMIRKYVEKMLEVDGKQAPFQYIRSEKRMDDLFTLSNAREIRLKGYIDRIDAVGDSLRIIDYKSGSGSSSFRTIESLFDTEEKDRSKAVMQVFMYAWMYHRLPEGADRKIRPGIYYMRSLFGSGFTADITQKEERGKSEVIEDFRNHIQPFEEAMRHCLEEIFNSPNPFTQTPTGKACLYCQFKGICGK
ncbi:PD-(D/E)XK nuclease family protein [Parabacteroides sp. PF5-6]|uniref:PD-(D/E)XK nuclease family protein n=1 Tax=Parabacteroides sp. PF5-6 TaxID=1742403 RepID=UPI0024074AFF|nr:PD-(D/E)XK nuclease family protein [Parabacteroides sp. PF5-6]MDF9831066.1 hypothetical protein [Parabacteroides sp. PF5-6]